MSKNIPNPSPNSANEKAVIRKAVIVDISTMVLGDQLQIFNEVIICFERTKNDKMSFSKTAPTPDPTKRRFVVPTFQGLRRVC
jgi:hypothetical protein